MIGFNGYDKRMMGRMAMGLYTRPRRNTADINDCMKNNGDFLKCLRPYQ